MSHFEVIIYFGFEFGANVVTVWFHKTLKIRPSIDPESNRPFDRFLYGIGEPSCDLAGNFFGKMEKRSGVIFLWQSPFFPRFSIALPHMGAPLCVDVEKVERLFCFLLRFKF